MKEGEIVIFVCEFFYEKMYVVWFKNDVKFYMSRIVFILFEGKIYKLEMREVILDDIF